MYQRDKIPEILIDRSWTMKEIGNISRELNTSEKDVKDILDFHFKGVSDALRSDKTNIEVKDLIRFQLRPNSLKKKIEKYQANIEYYRVQYKNSPAKLKVLLARTQDKIDYLNTKITNFNNLGNGI